MNDTYRIPVCGLTPEEVRELLGTAPPEPRAQEIRDPFEPEAPYKALEGDQKSRNEQISHDEISMVLLALNNFSTIHIGHACGVSRECVRKRLIGLGIDRKIKRR